MAELVKGSTELPDKAAIDYAASLMRHYGFEVEYYTIEQMISSWLGNYSINWVRLAIVEALYQGRYKAVSVEQILAFWKRRGQPIHHFNHEFEHLVCDKFPRDLSASPTNGHEKNGRPSFPEPELFHPKLFARSSSFRSVPSASQEMSQWEGSSYFKTETQPSLLEQGEPSTPVDPSSKATAEVASPSSPSVEVVPLPESELEVEDKPPTENPETSANLEPPSLTSTQNGECDRPPPTQFNSKQDAVLPLPSLLPNQNQNGLPEVLNLAGTEILLPALGLSNPALKPKLKLHLTTLYQPNWLISSASKPPIHQFTPISETSDFYSKLKAVAKPDDAGGKGLGVRG